MKVREDVQEKVKHTERIIKVLMYRSQKLRRSVAKGRSESCNGCCESRHELEVDPTRKENER